MKTSRSLLPKSFLVCGALVGLLPVACVTEDVDPEPVGGGGTSETTAMGGASGGSAVGSGGINSGGAATTGGATGIMDDPTYAMAVVCPALQQPPLLTDFTFAAPGAADAGATDGGAAGAGANPAPANPMAGIDATFGIFSSTLSGGTFRYPSGGNYPVASDVTMDNWHLSGNIGDYSGFGIYINLCNVINAAAYDGISFTVRGNVAMGNTLTFSVGTSSNDITHVWLNANVPANATMPAPVNSGRCIPTMGQYDGSCAAPTYTVPVTATDQTITVLWSQLVGGRPEPSVNPAEITSIGWIFPNPIGAGTATPTTYAADVVIDNLSFVGGP
jgi:hypothetical protein